MKAMPIFKKFIASYALLVALPIIVLCTAVFVFFYNNYLNDNIQFYDNMLTRQVAAFDDSLDNLNKITSSIEANPYLSYGYMGASTSNQLTALSYFKIYEVANGFGALLHLMHFENMRVLTTEGTLNQPYFYQKYNSPELDPNLIVDRLTKTRMPYLEKLSSISPRYANIGYLYATVLTDGLGEPNGCVLYLLNKKSIDSFAENLSGVIQAPTLIVGLDGEIIASAHCRSKGALVKAALSAPGPAFRHEGKSYYLLRHPSHIGGMTFYSITDPYALDSGFLLLLQVVGGSLVFILVVASALIRYLMRTTYHPLITLEREAVASATDGTPITLQSIVSTVSERLEKLDNYYIATVDQRSNNLLLGLLTNSIGDHAALQEEQSRSGLNLDGSFFAAASLLFENLTAKDKEALRQHARGFVSVRCFPVDIFKRDSLAFILVCDDDGAQAVRSAALSLRDELKELYGGTVTIGVGDIVDSLQDLDKSYINSLSSLEARLIKGVDSVIMFDDIKAQTASTFQYPYQLVEQFKNALLSNDVALIDCSIDSIFAKIKGADMAIITTRTFCCHIAQLAVKSLQTGSSAQDNLQTINRLTQAETVDILAQSLKDICAAYLRQHQANSGNAGYIQDMQAYIQQNYCDPDFSLQQLADYFHMSPSYVSRYFAAQNNGVSMLEHTNRLRMDKAKQLLAETDMPIPDVAAAVAFLNLSSFSRKFKQTVGVPPGMYRQQCAEKQHSETITKS